ncbi:MAG TPA: surface-adhesin E family protein [Methylophilaceae bacterium]|nr:surface-adhesin E family protein [Methylophilaceae bacterium]
MNWLVLLLLTMAMQVQAADWQFLGASEAGQHYVDPSTLQWESGKTAFQIATKVQEQSGGEWLITLRIDCKENSFAYLSGQHTEGGKTLLDFATPRPAESINAGSMPDQLQQEYCRVADRKGIQWQAIGKSDIATVYFDPASVRQNKDGTRFKVNTRVQPFSGEEQTFSSLSFNCTDDTFTVLRLSKVKDGQTEQVFDKPQQAMATAKTATLSTLAAKFCGKPAANTDGKAGDQTNHQADHQADHQAECEQALTKLKGLEAQVQYDFDHQALQCKRAKAYVQQIRGIDKTVRRLHCAVADLQGYMQTVEQAGCSSGK